MKILSWNVGNFIWLKYLPKKQHYSFQRDNLKDVLHLIRKENADVIFLQEVLEEDTDFLLSNFTEYDFQLKISTKDRVSKSLFISKYKIEEIHHTNSDDYVINGITFFPIHLNAFSPEKRYQQVSLLTNDIPTQKGIVVGDANLWILDYFKKYFFFSKKDQKSYLNMVENNNDLLFGLGPTSRAFLSLDKMFATKDIGVKNTKIIKHNIGHIDHYALVFEIK
jgi:endonuclease/exonuclease/phosphatase family metal-dependent hydrolase